MSSTNPLDKVCGDLHELMLQHFDKSDVLKASEVSPEWNEAISTSAKCMAKLTLRIGWCKEEVPEVIRESQRQYNDLKIKCGFKELDQISKRKFQLITKFAPFLKKLRIEKILKIHFNQNLHLPKLESLKIDANVPIAFVKVTKLKKLSLHHINNYNRATIDWIEKQEKLEELKLGGLNEVFFNFNPKVPKGIKRYECIIWCRLTDDDAAKFNNFMEPMCDTLTSLILSGKICPPNIEMIVNEMSKLKTLKLRDSIENLNKTKLKSNKNITALSILNFHPGIHYLLLSLVNLEELEIFHATNIAGFEWIARNLMKLRKLSCWFRQSHGEIVQRYNEMKAAEEGINMDIEID
jgi:hypothetical protein